MPKRKLIILLAILLIAMILRIGFFCLNPDNIDPSGADEPWSMVNISLQWLKSHDATPDLNFGPLYTYMVSALHFISANNLIFVVRTITIVISILFVYLYFNLIRNIIDEKAAFFSAFLLAIYPLHVHLSSVSLAEVPAYFLLFSSLFLLHKFIEQKTFFYIIISSTALTLSCMYRYECWAFIFLFSMVLFFHYRSFWHTLIYFILSSLFPLIWAGLNYKLTGDPLGFAKTSSSITSIGMQKISLFDRIYGFMSLLPETLTMPVFILCILGLYISLVTAKKRNLFLFLFLAIFLIFEIRSVQGSYDYSILRYSLLLGLFLIPFGGIFFSWIYDRIWAKGIFKIASVLLITTLSFSYVPNTLATFSGHTKTSESVYELADWLKHNLRGDERILLEAGIYHPFIVINSNLNYAQIIHYNIVGFYRDESILKESLEDSMYIAVYKNKFHQGGFKNFAEGPYLNSYSTEEVFDNIDWKVLKLEKK